METQQHRQHRALARSGRAHQRHGFAGADMQVEPVQRRRVRAVRVMEDHLVEMDRAAQRLRQGLRRGRRHDQRLFVEQFTHPAHAAGGTLQLVPDLGQCTDRTAADQRVQHELAQRAGRHAARNHIVRAQPQHRDDRTEDQHDRHCGHGGLGADAHLCGVDGGQQCRTETLAFVTLARMRLHGAHGAQGFGRQRIGVGHAVLACARNLLQAACAQHDRQYRQRDADQGEAGQTRAGDEQHHHAANDRCHAPQGHRHGAADQPTQQFAVGRQA